MPLETANFIQGLDQSYPLREDPTNQGDDHLRLIKHVLITQFPGVDGDGYKEAIVATEEELNALSGLTNNVQEQLDAITARIDALEGTLSAESGTRMAFHQALAPTGWTQDTSITDHMMRVVGVAGGGNGGLDSPIINDKVPPHTHPITSSSHSHEYTGIYDNDQANNAHQAGIYNNHSAGNITRNTSSTSHTHSMSTNTGAANWEPQYVDIIIASKDQWI